MSPLAHLDARDLSDLADADALTAFFERLEYLPERLEQVPENLGIHTESVRRPIRRVERIARQGDAVLPFEVYLFELSKLTLTHTRSLVKAFRDRAGNFLSGSLWSGLEQETRSRMPIRMCGRPENIRLSRMPV